MPRSAASRWFQIANNTSLILLAVLCMLPLVHVLALSLSVGHAVTANEVTFWPVGTTLFSYAKTLENPVFIPSLWLSVQRTILSTVIGMIVVGLAAYVMSKGGGAHGVAGYRLLVFFFIVAMLFQGGIIPSYVLIHSIGLYDRIWALVLPNAVNIFHLILMMNFFKALPKELEEAAFVDGANHWGTFWRVFVPLSKPVVATVGLFVIVHEWNSWFDGMLYMKGDHVPLSTYLRSAIAAQVANSSDPRELAELNDRSIKSAQMMIGALPILAIYPFLQKYFAKGVLIGAVKE